MWREMVLPLLLCVLLVQVLSAHPVNEGDDSEETNPDILLLRNMKAKHDEIGLVTPAQLQQMLNDENVRLIDVREPWELTKEGKIGPSVNIPLGDVEEAFKMNDDDFKAKYDVDKPAKDDCNLVFHCKSGKRSMKAAQTAQSLGYKCPRSLDGGFAAWKEFLIRT